MTDDLKAKAAQLRAEGLTYKQIGERLGRAKATYLNTKGNYMRVIGLGQYSRTGKDTLANFLVAELQHRGTKAAKMSFASKVKSVSHDLYAWSGLKEAAWYDTKEGEKDRDKILPGINKTPVELWVAVGMAMREIHPSTWVDYLLRGDHGVDVLVIPDVRFINEVEAIREAGGTLIKVVRPGYGPRPTVADRALVGWDGWDYVIGGSGEMSELNMWAGLFANWLCGDADGVCQSEQNRQEALAVEDIKPWTPPKGWVKPAWYPDKYLVDEALAA